MTRLLLYLLSLCHITIRANESPVAYDEFKASLQSFQNGKGCSSPPHHGNPGELNVGINKPLGVHFSACAQGGVGGLLSGHTCQTTDVYVNLHCGGECKLCKKMHPHVMNRSEKAFGSIFKKLSIPKVLNSCTTIMIDPPGGRRYAMLFNFIQLHYDKLPEVLVLMKDTYQNTIFKSEKRNKGLFLKKRAKTNEKAVPVPIPTLLKLISRRSIGIGFQHLTHRTGWSTGGFIEKHETLGKIFKDFWHFFTCTEAPNNWPAVPGGLVAVERSRILRHSRETYQLLRNVLMKTLAAVGIEHNLGALFGCAGPDMYPRCPPLSQVHGSTRAESGNRTTEQLLPLQTAFPMPVPDVSLVDEPSNKTAEQLSPLRPFLIPVPDVSLLEPSNKTAKHENKIVKYENKTAEPVRAHASRAKPSNRTATPPQGAPALSVVPAFSPAAVEWKDMESSALEDNSDYGEEQDAKESAAPQSSSPKPPHGPASTAMNRMVALPWVVSLLVLTAGFGYMLGRRNERQTQLAGEQP